MFYKWSGINRVKSGCGIERFLYYEQLAISLQMFMSSKVATSVRNNVMNVLRLNMASVIFLGG